MKEKGKWTMVGNKLTFVPDKPVAKIPTKTVRKAVVKPKKKKKRVGDFSDFKEVKSSRPAMTAKEVIAIPTRTVSQAKRDPAPAPKKPIGVDTGLGRLFNKGIENLKKKKKN